MMSFDRTCCVRCVLCLLGFDLATTGVVSSLVRLAFHLYFILLFGLIIFFHFTADVIVCRCFVGFPKSEMKKHMVLHRFIVHIVFHVFHRNLQSALFSIVGIAHLALRTMTMLPTDELCKVIQWFRLLAFATLFCFQGVVQFRLIYIF